MAGVVGKLLGREELVSPWVGWPVVLVLALSGCTQTHHDKSEPHQLLGSLSGTAARGVFVAEHVASLADQV